MGGGWNAGHRYIAFTTFNRKPHIQHFHTIQVFNSEKEYSAVEEGWS
jgi:hypothetical protein